MTFAEAKLFVLDGLKEVVATHGLVPDQESLRRWINSANGAVFLSATNWNPDPWAVRSLPIEYDPANGYISLIDFDGGPLSSPLVLALGGAARLGVLLNLEMEDSNGVWHQIKPVDLRDRSQYDRLVGISQALEPYQYAYSIEGQSLILAPQPNTVKTLQATYVPVLPDLLNNTQQDQTLEDMELLGGVLPSFHDLVCFKAMQLYWRKDEERVSPWDEEVKGGLDDLRQTLRRTQRHGSRRVRRLSSY